MKILHRNLKAGELKVLPENLDDLWYLSNIIEPGDSVRGETERKIRIGDKDSENTRVVRKKLYLTIKAEKIEFNTSTNTLRALGIIREGPDDISIGSHHTIILEAGKKVLIRKEQWLKYQLQRLEEACKTKHSDILVLIFDREEAIFGLLKARGWELLSRIRGDVQKKDMQEESKGNFYKKLVKQAEEYWKRHKLKHIIIASPGFWKDYLIKEISEEMRKNVVLANCSDVSETSINEIMKRPELKQVLEQDRTAKEEKLIEDLLRALNQDKAAYGQAHTTEQAGIGAISKLFITDKHIHHYREEGKHKQVEEVMRTVENTGGEVHVLSREEPCKKLESLGGIAGILRWKTQ